MIERQPAHGAVAHDNVEAGRPGHAGEIGHQGALGDLHAVRMARAARGELDIAKVVGAERPEIDLLFRQRLDRGHAAVQADRRELPGGVGQEAREIVDAHRRHRTGSRKLAAQLVEVGILAADADRDRDRHRQQAGILRPEEGVEKAGPGVGSDQESLAAAEARADQAAGRDLGAGLDVAPGQGRENLSPDIIEGDPGLPLGCIVQHLGDRPEVGATQGKLGIAGGQRLHGSRVS